MMLQSSKLGEFRQSIKYVINNRHSFEFMVFATIEPVSLQLSSLSFKFQFNDEANLSLEYPDTIRLTNNGNAIAKFKWKDNE